MDIPRKNEECIIAIEDLSREGEGIGRYGGYTLFVKDAVPGDRVRCVVTKAGKTFGYAHLLQVITPSPDRRKLPCPVGKTCGGCTLLSMNYEAQLYFKQKLVEETLRRVGGVSVNVSPVLGA
ncbi:MAG: TRAM domain-containing protein, partial [Lachnospiraceae bacterium]|nr:TRAM domain-containing protein [Lachnospiraceae bacterium]